MIYSQIWECGELCGVELKRGLALMAIIVGNLKAAVDRMVGIQSSWTKSALSGFEISKLLMTPPLWDLRQPRATSL